MTTMSRAIDDMEDDITPVVDAGDIVQMIQSRILHTLTIYPRLNPSMLQVGIGTGLSPSLWHPVLEQLISQGKVIKSFIRITNPITKRDQTYTVLERAPEVATVAEATQTQPQSSEMESEVAAS